MKTVARFGIGAALVVVAASCTTLDEPRGRDEVDGATIDAGAAEAEADAGGEAGLVIPCARTHNWRVRGLPASFFAAKEEGVGAWGIGDYFRPADMPDTVILDAYVAGTADELRGRRVSLGQGHNARLDTLTHLFALRIGCDETGTNCAPGLYVPVAGEAVATRLEPDNGTSLEIEASNVVLRRAVTRGNGYEFTDGPEACEFFYRLVVAGETFAPTRTCAQHAAPECPFVANAADRHP